MSEVEKATNVDNLSNSDTDQLVDPDAGLSEEERAKIVSNGVLIL